MLSDAFGAHLPITSIIGQMRYVAPIAGWPEQWDKNMDDVVLEGLALKAAVRAAETPVTGQIVARNLVAQLELDSLADVDLRRDGSPPPAILPHRPALAAEQPASAHEQEAGDE
jgi:hypothetical protein